MISIKINLLPWRDELKVLRENLFKRILIYAAVVGIIIAGGATFAGKIMLDERNLRLAAIDEELNKYSQAQKLLTDRKNIKNSLEKQIVILKDLGQQRYNIVKLMEVFAATIPEDSVIMSLGFTINDIGFEALTRDQEVLAEHTRNIERSIGQLPIPPNNDILLKHGKLVNYVARVVPAPKEGKK